MKNTWVKKGLVVSVILLFIGVAIAPSINFNVVKASSDNDLVEVTTQACGITGLQPKTVKLTKQQNQEVKAVFDELKNRLSNAKTREETNRIFNETILSLYHYNLLPRGMSIEQAKQLVTDRGYNQKALKLLQKIFMKFGAGLNTGGINNSFCTVAGSSNNTHFLKPIIRIAGNYQDKIGYLAFLCWSDFLFGRSGVAFIELFIVLLSLPFVHMLNILSGITKFLLSLHINHTGVDISYGNYFYYSYPPPPHPDGWFYPANGWISTNGTNGIQNISGSLWGQNVVGGWQPLWDWNMNYTFRGVIGFKGLIIKSGVDDVNYLGSARYVNVGPDRPDVPWP